MWLGFFADKAGDKQKAEKYFKEALECPFANVFRLETARVLEKMSQYLPDNWKIHYYLGNLNYDKIPEKAVAEWEKSLILPVSAVHMKFPFHRILRWTLQAGR